VKCRSCAVAYSERRAARKSPLPSLYRSLAHAHAHMPIGGCCISAYAELAMWPICKIQNAAIRESRTSRFANAERRDSQIQNAAIRKFTTSRFANSQRRDSQIHNVARPADP
jgi:hypothetical protein